ncbi:MAG: hypothetical protein ACJA0N_000715 [Pseudohongiellaceae bacterium]|jgi:hypothetical protein
MSSSDLKNEWCHLQQQFDSYENCSLLIKLLNITLVATAYFLNSLSFFIGFLLLILWMQDAIWKTFQSRIETRLLQIESSLTTEATVENNIQAYQFNTQYLQNRPGSMGLINEYFRQAIRPTIAFPHCILLFILGFALLF